MLFNLGIAINWRIFVAVILVGDSHDCQSQGSKNYSQIYYLNT